MARAKGTILKLLAQFWKYLSLDTRYLNEIAISALNQTVGYTGGSPGE